MAASLALQVTYVSAAPGPLTISPIGWNVVGLDSNNVNTGPNVFPIGARVCNTGTSEVANLSVAWSWGSANAYVGLTGSTSFDQDSLDAGACDDFYFNVQVTRDAAAYDTARSFTISASGGSVATVTAPSPREIYVEHLVSQNRNAVLSWTLSDSSGCDSATGVVLVGSTCTATIVSKTATGGYEQLVNSYYFDNSLFRVESLSSTYSVPAGYVNTQMYADACGWENDPGDPDYLSCLDTDPIAGGKAGGNPITTTVTFTVVGAGAQSLTGVIYDFSGSSYHYNSDVGGGVNLMALTAQNPPSVPDAAPDAATTNEDTPVDIDVLANDSDVDGDLDPSSLAVDSQPSNGTAAVVGGEIRYTPSANFAGNDSFTYEVCDTTSPTPLCSGETVTLTVNAVNDPPTAVDDVGSVNEDGGPVTIDVLANDSDPDGSLDPSSVTVTSGPADGTASANPDGTVDYDPDPDFSGSDSFTYEVCDLNGACSTATVSATVAEVNDPPNATDDAASVDEDSSVSVSVLSNDSDPDDGLDPGSVSVTGAPADGSTVVNPDGSIGYTPDPGFSGSDSFTYEVCDLAGACASADVDIVVGPVNDPPAAADDVGNVDEDDGTETIAVLANDSDPEGSLDASSVSVVAGPSDGSASPNPDGTIDYTPDPDFWGVDSFDYEVCDTDSACSAATVTVTVAAVNDAPVAADDADTTDQDVAIDVDVAANDDDTDGDPLTVSSLTQPANGSVSDNGDGTIHYIPDPGWSGEDSFTYDVCDASGACDSATVTVVVVASVNLPPIALDDAGASLWGIEVGIDVLANDSDPDGSIDTASVTVTGVPADGSASVQPDGSIKYLADDGFVGVDTFVYRVCDDWTPAECDTATVTITLSANEGPDAVDDVAVIAEDAGPVTIAVLANDSDPEGGPLSVTGAGPAADGTVTVNPAGTIDYEPNADFNGSDSFTYTVCDAVANCTTATVTVTVNAVNDPPIVRNDRGRVRAGRSVNLSVLANDGDPDGSLDASTVTLTSVPAHGTATVKPDGSVDFLANDSFEGDDTFAYRACDDLGSCRTARVVVEIWMPRPNQRPNANDDEEETQEDTPVTIDVLRNDADPDGDELHVAAAGQPKHGSVELVGGRLVFTPDPDWNGTAMFTYVACDPEGKCDLATVEVRVIPVDDAPVAHDDAVSTDGAGSVEIEVLENDDDVEGQSLSVSIVLPPAHGSATVTDDGTIVYEPREGYSGQDSFTYEICEPDGDCSQATVFVEVLGAHPLPAPGQGSGQLADTGANVTAHLRWGLVMLVVGSLLLRASRRSRTVGSQG